MDVKLENSMNSFSSSDTLCNRLKSVIIKNEGLLYFLLQSSLD